MCVRARYEWAKKMNGRITTLRVIACFHVFLFCTSEGRETPFVLQVVLSFRGMTHRRLSLPSPVPSWYHVPAQSRPKPNRGRRRVASISIRGLSSRADPFICTERRKRAHRRTVLFPPRSRLAARRERCANTTHSSLLTLSAKSTPMVAR